MPFRDSVLYTYNDAIEALIQVGTKSFDWARAAVPGGGFSKLLIMGSITNAGGATAIFVDQSHDGVNVAVSSADLFAQIVAGVEVNVAAPWVRVRIVQTTAAITAGDLFVKVSD